MYLYNNTHINAIVNTASSISQLQAVVRGD